MHARCTICLEAFGEDNAPLATPCGHLYCIDCATYNFAEDGALCAVCRRPQALEALVRLYPDWERTDAEAPPRAAGARTGRGVAEAGCELVGACRGVLERGDVGGDALEPVLLNAECFAESVAESSSGATPGVERLLNALTSVLTDIRAKLKDVERLKKSEDERRKYKAACRKQRAQLEGLAREQDEDRRAAAAQLAEQRSGWAQRAASLHERLQSAHAGLAGAHIQLDAQKHELRAVRAEMEEWRAKSVKYKKKYHALQAKLAVLKGGARAEPEDDSLIVI